MEPTNPNSQNQNQAPEPPLKTQQQVGEAEQSFSKPPPPTPYEYPKQNQTEVTPPPKPKFNLLRFILPLAFLALFFGGSYFVFKLGYIQKIIDYFQPKPTPIPINENQKELSVVKFTSDEEFVEYIKNNVSSQYMGRMSQAASLLNVTSTISPEPFGAVPTGLGSEEKAGIDRVSGTNVQVLGVDEPDTVKTDGNTIFVSPSTAFPRFTSQQERLFPSIPSSSTHIIKAYPPGEMENLAQIVKSGNLLLSAKILTILSGNTFYGFDITKPESPQEKWKFELDDKHLVTAWRLYQNKIYIVVQTNLHSENPCPLPLSKGQDMMQVLCTDIYRPPYPTSVDSIYTVLRLDSQTGIVDRKVTFIGSSGSSVTYMSPNSLYISYPHQESLVNFFYNFLSDKAKDIVPGEVISKIESVKNLSISENAKTTELGVILEKYQDSLTPDDRLKVENELGSRFTEYIKTHVRDLTKSGIVKVDTETLEPVATREVPGSILNQFSLDEYNNYLRVVTTTSSFGSDSTVNDLYILDQNMVISGKIEGLAQGERIYSARFIGNRGYLVTFKQIDPFFVFDLTDPKNPKLTGELKIPGYSSYLHALEDNKILGVGMEGSGVKAAVFDVSDAANPKEQSKYNLTEYWSDILNTHHAFLLDSKHKVFFLPGSQGGYIFSYDGGVLKLQKAVSGVSPKRAIIVNDYLYIIADNKIVVINEADWQKVSQLEY